MDDSIGTYKTNTGGNISSLEMLDEPKINPFSTKNGYIFKYILMHLIHMLTTAPR